MLKKIMSKSGLLKWMPHKEQDVYERKLTRIMKRLKIEDFNFNWDRNSCFIEFAYLDDSYRLEHSIEKAKEKGIFLDNGLDCLMELTESLEELCAITDRGIGEFETWISGMKQVPEAEEVPEYEEEFHLSYKSSGRQSPPQYHDDSKDFIPPEPEPSLREFDENGLIRRPRRSRDLFEKV